MTLDELRDVLAELPDTIPVSQYKSLKENLPRVVWNETSMEQNYGSNGADDLMIRVVVELIASPSDTSAVWELIRLFRKYEITFTCTCGYDENDDVVSYELSIYVTEAFPDG